MFKMFNKTLFFFVFSSSISVNASPFYGSSVNAGGINDDDGSVLSGASVFQNLLGSTASSGLTNETYQELRNYGLNQDVPVSTTITYSGQAQSSSSGLQSMVSGEQARELYTPVPSDDLKSGLAQYSVNARASFSDTLTLLGANDLSSIQFDVNIHGSRSNAPFGSFIQVDGSGVGFGSNDSTWDGINDFNLVLQSGVLDINNGSVDIALSLLTSLDFSLGGEGIIDSDDIFREVDFFNTVTINQFRGFNTSGELVDLSSAIGSDGQSFDVLRVTSSVPAPAAVWLISFCLVGLVGKRNMSSKFF